MKKALLFIFCLILFLSGCNKTKTSSGSSGEVDLPPIVRTDDPEMLLYGNTLANINSHGEIVENKDKIYYVFQNQTILEMDRADVTKVRELISESSNISNLLLHDNYLYYIINNNAIAAASIKRIDLNTGVAEVLTDDVSVTRNILVILEDKLYFLDANAYYARSDLDGSNAKLFGYTIVQYPSFDGTYFYGIGYDMMAQYQFLRVYQTDPATDKSKIFFETKEAFNFIPNPNGYLVLAYQDSSHVEPYEVFVLDKEGKQVEVLDVPFYRPLSQIKDGVYYNPLYGDTGIFQDRFFKFDTATNEIEIIDNTDAQKYATWMVLAYGLDSAEYHFFLSDEILYAMDKRSEAITQVWPIPQVDPQ
ncbi:MAG: DUF5050 domain-containing protein [Erysipelotrichaceae bacterium]|jgi:hypothetical protein|nr:DUF5050 domain-containing protein [Erysipelotrichaceae bacterium]